MTSSTQAPWAAHFSGVVFSYEIQRAIAVYEGAGARDRSLWRWVWRGLELTTLSSVPQAHRRRVCEIKLLGVMLGVLIDDVADEHDDPELLACLLAVTRGERPRLAEPSGWRQATLGAVFETWTWFRHRMIELPHHAELDDLVAFDLEQMGQAMRYSALLRRHPGLANITEHRDHLPANMMMVLNGMVDLMASPPGFVRELGPIRELLILSQRMGRIGNAVTTWEREIGEGDRSSDVFAMVGAIDDPEELRQAVLASGAEELLLAEWQGHQRELLARSGTVVSVDVDTMIAGLDALLRLHLESRGHK